MDPSTTPSPSDSPVLALADLPRPALNDNAFGFTGLNPVLANMIDIPVIPPEPRHLEYHTPVNQRFK